MYEHLTDMLLQHHPRFISVGDKRWYRDILNADLKRLDAAGYVIVKKPENGLPVMSHPVTELDEELRYVDPIVPAGQMTVDDCIAELGTPEEYGLDMPVPLSRGWDADGDPED